MLDILLEPLRGQENVNLHFVKVEPQKPYPFPWPKIYFFSIFPETVYEVPVPLNPLKFNENIKYDLIILGCQVWFLAPSLPITSLLKHEKNKVFHDTPVIAVLTCRKMWKSALECVEKKLNSLESRLIDKVVVCAQGSHTKTLFGTRENLFKPTKILSKFTKNQKWEFGQKDLKLIKQMGEELSCSLEDVVSKGKNPVFTEASLSTRDYKFYYPEIMAKNNFLFFGKFIKKYSRPDTLLRYCFTLIFSIIFLANVFIAIPILELFFRVRSYAKGENNALATD